MFQRTVVSERPVRWAPLGMQDKLTHLNEGVFQTAEADSKDYAVVS